MPTWLFDFLWSTCGTREESKPPPLEVDCSSETSENQTIGMETIKGHENGDMMPDWLVYDPDFGVISRELQNQWQEQSKKRQDEYNQRKNSKKSIPPVRR